MEYPVNKIDISTNGIVHFLRDTTLVAVCSKASDVSVKNSKISVLLADSSTIEFSVADITLIGTTAYDIVSTTFLTGYKTKLYAVYLDLITNIFGSCCSSFGFEGKTEITNYWPSEITKTSSGIIIFKDSTGAVLFGVKEIAPIQRLGNTICITTGFKKALIDVTKIFKIDTDTYDIIDTSTFIDTVKMEQKITDILTNLTERYFLACEATGGATVSIDLPVLDFTSTAERIDDCSPAGWPNSSNVVKVIHAIPNVTRKMQMWSGLTNGVAGRVVTIRNESTDNLILLEAKNPLSAAGNRFRFEGRSAYFLFPGHSVTLLHDGIEWGQQAGHTKNGHDMFDDFGGPNNTGTAPLTSYYGEAGYGMAAGTGATLRNEVWIAGSIGTMGLTIGTTAGGYAVMKMNGRGAVGYLTGATQSKICVVSRLAVNTMPTALQDWRFHMGISAGSNTNGITVTGSIMWYCSSASPFWKMYAANTAGTIIADVVSTVPVTTSAIVLGTWFPNNMGDCVYFYSSDGGITYNIEHMFVRTTNNYGGAPVIGSARVAGTTNLVTVNLDYIGISIKGATI